MSTDTFTAEMHADPVYDSFDDAGDEHADSTFADTASQARAATEQLRTKSFAFALRIVKLQQYLVKQNEQVMSSQLLRCGTAIGALAREAALFEGMEFFDKLILARKEAIETEYWLELLHQAGYINAKGIASIQPDITELLKLLAQLIQAAEDI